MQEMDRRMALLRLLLADIETRAREARHALEQLQKQQRRIVDFAVRQNIPVSSALSSLAEVEERITQQAMAERHLDMLRARARSELDALRVTRGVADARARMADLEARRAALPTAAGAQQPASGDDAHVTTAVPDERAAIDAEIAALRTAIEEASEEAARSLTTHEEPGERPSAHGSGTSRTAR